MLLTTTASRALAFAAALLAAPAVFAGAAPVEDVVTGPAAGEYRLGIGDKLRIEVYKDTQLSQNVEIRPDGKITLPLIGDIDANGRTPGQLRETIATDLKTYMTNPVVTVIVVDVKLPVAYVMGAVNHPGAVTLQDNQLTVLQALALAGGLKDFSSKDIKILRRSGTGEKATNFNYKDAIHGAAPVYLHAGDTVVVPD